MVRQLGRRECGLPSQVGQGPFYAPHAAGPALIVVIGFGLSGIGCWAIVLGSLGGPPGEIVGDVVFVARAKTY